MAVHLEVDQAVLGEEREHVVEEPDAGVDLRDASAVEVDPQRDVGLGGLALQAGFAGGSADDGATRAVIAT